MSYRPKIAVKPDWSSTVEVSKLAEQVNALGARLARAETERDQAIRGAEAAGAKLAAERERTRVLEGKQAAAEADAVAAERRARCAVQTARDAKLEARTAKGERNEALSELERLRGLLVQGPDLNLLVVLCPPGQKVDPSNVKAVAPGSSQALADADLAVVVPLDGDAVCIKNRWGREDTANITVKWGA